MKNDPSRPHGPTWRQQPGAGGRNPKAQQDWRKDTPPAPAGTRVWSRKTKMWAGVITLGGLFAALVAVIFWLLPARSPSLFLFANGYQMNLAIPPNYYGAKLLGDLDHWARLSPDSFWSRDFPEPQEPLRALAKGSNWFKDVNRDRFKEKTVVIFFALHGGADKKGPYLLFDDAAPRDGEDGLLRLQAVLDRLKELPKSKNKVLILDATQVPANWEFGMMHNDFARKLKDLNSEIQAIDNCIVLSASDVDQRSWSSDILQRTIFSHYLFEGLKGAVHPDSTARINAADLFQYVKTNVENWVRNNRDEIQTPVLLPEGPEGLNRAKDIIMTQVPKAYGSPTPPQSPPSLRSDELAKQWQEFVKLQDQVLMPAAYHPHLWQRYQALMLRYELLVRMGDEDSAKQLKNQQLDRVAEKLKESPFHNLISLENTIPMPAACGLGMTPEQRRTLDQKFEDLWGDPSAEWKKLQDWAKKEKIERAETQLRLRCCDLLLERLIQKYDPQSREQARAVLKEMAPASSFRPAEVHYLSMALTRLPDKQPPECLQKAVETRRLAEQTALAVYREKKSPDLHPFSENVYLWIKDRVDQADKKRRWGEDLLFSSDPVRWEQALKLLGDAQKIYTEAGTDAHTVTLALDLRDQMMATLPAYAHWLAERRTNREQLQEALGKLEELWAKVHRLSDRLENPDPKGIREATVTTWEKSRELEPRSIQRLMEEINQSLDGFQKAYVNRAAGLNLQAHNQLTWHEIDALLQLPCGRGIDPGRRKELLEGSRTISFDLFSKFARLPRTEPAPAGAEPANALERARYQARMALAVLGEPWVNHAAGETGKRLRDLRDAMNRVDDKTWHEEFLAFGQDIGRCWTRLPEDINGDLRNAHKPETKPADAAAHLNRAELLCRQVAGAAVGTLDDNRLEDCLRLRLSQWLVWLAGRTIGDQWFAEEPQQKPYYQDAANRLWDSAQALLLKGWDRQTGTNLFAAVDQLKKTIRETPALSFDKSAPAEEWFTSEREKSLQYQLAAGTGLQPGYPVIDMEFPPDQSLLKPTGLVRPDQWITQALGTDEQTRPPVYSFSRGAPPAAGRRTVENIQLKMKAFYRGREVIFPTTIHFYPQPDTIITRYPRPDFGKVAVRTDAAIERRFDPRNGTISIVLDCTGSMWDPPTERALAEWKQLNGTQKQKYAAFIALNAKERLKGQRRFDKAVKALGDVLDEISNGFAVNLWAFGQVNDAGDGVQEDAKLIWSTEKWNRESDTPKVKQLVQRLVPFGETPLVDSLRKVRETDFQQNRTGFKSIVVLTDGMDNEFDKDNLKNPRVRIPKMHDELRRIFKDSGIQLYMVLFDVPKSEIEGAMEQFKIIHDWNPRGKLFDNTEDPEQLVRNLREALHPRLRYWLYKDKNIDPDGFLVTPGDSNLEWTRNDLERGSYRARVHDFPSQAIAIDPGDFLLLNLHRDEGDPYLRRALFANEYKARLKNGDIETKEQEAWQLAVLENSPNCVSKPRALQLKLTLENTKAGRTTEGSDLLRQIRPRFVWFEVDGGGKPLFQWSNLEGYPAPLWSLDLVDWPGLDGKPPKPVVSAWWTEGDPAAALLTMLKRNRAVPLAEDFPDARKKDRDRDRFALQSVAIEDRMIGEKQKSCLVVRIRYPKGEPVIAVPKNFNPVMSEGEQHYFYQEANQYTGIFWTVSADDFTLDLISLKDFKERAERDKTAIVKWPLQEPNQSYQWNDSWNALKSATAP